MTTENKMVHLAFRCSKCWEITRSATINDANHVCPPPGTHSQEKKYWMDRMFPGFHEKIMELAIKSSRELLSTFLKKEKK